MTPEEVIELNKGRYTFKSGHTSTKAAPYTRTPGKVLVEEFLVPYYPAELSDLAARTRIPLQRLRKLIRGQDRIDSRMADALGQFFGNGSDYWNDLQARFEAGEKL